MKTIIRMFTCFLCLTSCEDKNIKIESIDKELNDKAEYGIQYFEISTFKDLSNEELLSKLEYFEKTHNINRDLSSYNIFQVIFIKNHYSQIIKSMYLKRLEIMNLAASKGLMII